MRNFKEDDFDGAGQYIIRTSKGPNEVKSGGFLATTAFKIGYTHDSSFGSNVYTLISMTDGWTRDSFKDENGNWVKFAGDDNQSAKQKLVHYLNSPELCPQEYRHATFDEMVRVILHTKSRCRGELLAG